MAFGGFLKQSTAVDILIGPFVDEDDGKTAETGLTLDVELSKNGQALANKNDATVPVHDAAGTVDGYYNCELDATDTNTVGQLTVVAHVAGALPVRLDFQVVETIPFDELFKDAATGINAACDTALTDYDPPTKTEMDAAHALLATEAKQDIIDTNVDQIETAVITNAAGTDIAADIIAVKAETALIVEDTSELQTDDVPTLIAALPTAEETVDEFETQSQADPTGFHVNTMEVVGATPLTLSDIRPEMVSSKTRDDNTAATTSVIYTELAEATADHYNNMTIVFTSGALAGQSRRISDYSHDGTDGIVTVFPAFTEAPDDDSTFIITTPYFYMPLAGALEITYTVKIDDEDTGDPLAGVTVWISTDSAGNNVVWSGTTDANGIAVDANDGKPWLDAGTYYFWRQKAGYIFTNPDTEVFS